MEKILTIIVPTYNMELFLRQCLDSLIIPDNLDKIEVLIINDGSKDSSSAIAHEYQNKYAESFKVIDKQNGNYGSCINRGLKEAAGKYIKILDADDSFDTKHFNDFVKCLLNINVDLVITDFVNVNYNTHVEKIRHKPLKANSVLNYSELESYLITSRITMHMSTFRTDKLRAINYSQTEGISYTDQEWVFFPITTVDSAYYIPMPLYRYLTGREGQTMSAANFEKSANAHYLILKRMLELYKIAPEKYVNVLEARIAYVANIIYSICLTHKLSKETMIYEVEGLLKYSIPSVYGALDDCKISRLQYPYIKRWRRLPKMLFRIEMELVKIF